MKFGEELKDAILEAIEGGIKYDPKIGNHVIVDGTAYVVIKTEGMPINEKFGKRYAYEFTDKPLKSEKYIWLD